MHESIIKLNGYNIIKYSDTYWLKIFHQNSRVYFFKDKSEANYSINKNCFSILREIDSRFQIDNKYSLLMEYPQLYKYIRWTQTSDFSYVANESQNYEKISNNPGAWSRFRGLHSYPSSFTKSLYVGDNSGENWFFAVGVIYDQFKGVMPATENEIWLQFVDLWLEIDDFEKMKLLPPIFKGCTSNCRTNFLFSFSYYTVFILIYEK